MAATYTAGDTGNRNRLRLMIGDTPPAGGGEFPVGVDADFQDGELDDILTQEGDDLNKAAGAALEALASRLARGIDFTADGASFKTSLRVKEIRAQARMYRNRGRGATVIMPVRKDAFSDDVSGEEADTGGGTIGFDRGRFDNW